MMKIKYYAEDSSMGDTSGKNCKLYREWALSVIQENFPDYDVEVLNEPSTVQTWTNDHEKEEEIADFCHRLWDSCPWDFVD